MRNTPDDWGSFWTICPRCGSKYHLSEWCEVCEDWPDEEEEEDGLQDE